MPDRKCPDHGEFLRRSTERREVGTFFLQDEPRHIAFRVCPADGCAHREPDELFHCPDHGVPMSVSLSVHHTEPRDEWLYTLTCQECGEEDWVYSDEWDEPKRFGSKAG